MRVTRTSSLCFDRVVSPRNEIDPVVLNERLCETIAKAPQVFGYSVSFRFINACKSVFLICKKFVYNFGLKGFLLFLQYARCPMISNYINTEPFGLAWRKANIGPRSATTMTKRAVNARLRVRNAWLVCLNAGSMAVTAPMRSPTTFCCSIICAKRSGSPAQRPGAMVANAAPARC